MDILIFIILISLPLIGYYLGKILVSSSSSCKESIHNPTTIIHNHNYTTENHLHIKESQLNRLTKK